MPTSATPAVPAVENFGFMQKYPFLSAKLGMSMADSAGLDTKDPANLARALSSNAAKTKLQTFERAPEDQSAIDALFKNPAGAEVGGSVLDTTKASQQALAEGTRAKIAVYDDLKDASNTYSRLASFNKEAETQKRLTQLKPTEDIDKQITSVMTQAIREKARLRTELSDIDPAKRNAAITARMSVFTEEIANLSTLRAARVDAAKAKIGEEIDATEGRIDAARLRVESLGKELDFLTSIGADRVQYAEVARQYAEAQAKLAKAGSGGGLTAEELIVNAMIDKFQTQNGRQPNNDEIDEIRRRAKIVKNTRPDIVENVTRTGGASGEPVRAVGPATSDGAYPTSRLDFLQGVQLPLDAQAQEKARQAEADATTAVGKAKRYR